MQFVMVPNSFSEKRNAACIKKSVFTKGARMNTSKTFKKCFVQPQTIYTHYYLHFKYHARLNITRQKLSIFYNQIRLLKLA